MHVHAGSNAPFKPKVWKNIKYVIKPNKSVKDASLIFSITNKQQISIMLIFSPNSKAKSTPWAYTALTNAKKPKPKHIANSCMGNLFLKILRIKNNATQKNSKAKNITYGNPYTS